jgi:hypothetical protein
MATTTPNYGWSVPTSSDYVAQGAVAIETLGDSVDSTLFTALGGAYPGLRLVKKQTIGTGVSSVTVTGAFDATYPNYKILIAGGSYASSGNFMSLQVGGVTSGYKSGFIYTTWAAGVTSQQSASTNRFFAAGVCTTSGITADFELLSPFLSTHTVYSSRFAESGFGGGVSSGVLPTTNSYTSFTIFPDSLTITGGTIYVYGYGAS